MSKHDYNYQLLLFVTAIILGVTGFASSVAFAAFLFLVG